MITSQHSSWMTISADVILLHLQLEALYYLWHFGPEVFAEFLEGAAEEDKLAKNEDVMQNPAMLDALIGVYERNILGYPSTAVLPYSQALSRFPAHLQQLDMESNGKSVNRFGDPVNYVTGPVIIWRTRNKWTAFLLSAPASGNRHRTASVYRI